MSERETIPTCETGRDAICADQVDDGFVLSSFIAGDEDAQICLSVSAGRRLGEWLIERANQAGER